MSCYAPVGKAILRRIIGLSQNHTEYLCEHCEKCPNHTLKEKYACFPDSKEYKKAIDTCSSCPRAKKKYINEQNRYGTEMRLNRNAVLLFLQFHMMKPDRLGIVKNIPIGFLAKKLECDKKTIRNNLETLAANQMIYYSHGLDRSLINICLLEYKTYFLSAHEGGRGYYTLSDVVMEQLIAIKSVNNLRLTVKTLLDMDDKHKTVSSPTLSYTYQDIISFLPSYFKKARTLNLIKQMEEQSENTILTPQISKYAISFTLSHSCQPFLVKKEQELEARKEISSRLTSINESLSKQLLPSDRDFQIKELNVYTTLPEDDNFIADLVNISIEYSVDHIFYALSQYYMHYLVNGTYISNPGGLVRTIVTSLFSKTA